MSDYNTYKQEVVNRFWEFKNKNYADNNDLFESQYVSEKRPPVFKRKMGYMNVIVNKDLSEDVRQNVLSQIPRKSWHKWFTSMTSSQALTHSVFGNLKILNRLELLANITGEDGKQIFLGSINNDQNCKLEYEVKYLGEPRPTTIDVFFDRDFRVTVECKLSEYEIGPCSSGRNKKDCDGKYNAKKGQSERCVKSTRGIKYWKYIPMLFKWSAELDHNPCPLLDTYQLVRNVLAACVQRDGKLDYENGHAVLLYDERNPAFHPGGDGLIAWQQVRDALIYPSLLQKCTWQQVVASIRCEPELKWLTDSLCEKYGF